MPGVRRIVLAIVLIPIIALAVCEMLGWRFLRGPAERMLSEQLHRQVRIEAPFRLHLIGGVGIKAGGLWIAAPEGFDDPYFVNAHNAGLKLRYTDLNEFRKSGDLRIAGLEVEQLDARLVRHRDGHATWDFHKGDANRPTPLPVIEQLQVAQGQAQLVDATKQADIAVHFDTREGEADAAPLAHAELRGELRQRPIEGQLTTNGWLHVADRTETARPVALKGWLTYGGVRADLDGSATDIFGQRRVRSAVTVTGPSLGLVGHLIDKPLPTTSAFTMKGTLQSDGAVWRVDIPDARIGGSRLTGQLTFDPEAHPARLDGALGGSLLRLSDLAPAFGTTNEEGRPVPPPRGRIIPNRPLNLPALKRLDAKISVDIERVDLGEAFRQPITPFKARLELSEGKLALAQVDANTADGRLTGDISVDAGQHTAHWRADLAWQNIHLEDWIKAAKRPAGKGGKPPAGHSQPYVSGTLNGRARLSGTGQTTAELVGSLDGDVTLFVRNGHISRLVIEVMGLDVAQALGLVLTGDETLPMQCAVVDFHASNGEVAPKVALIDTPVTTLVASGLIDLRQEKLDLRIAAKPKNVSPFTVRSPIRIAGPLNAPKATPEGGPIAARVIGAAALALINPLAAIIPFIDPGSDIEQSPCRRSLAALQTRPAKPSQSAPARR